MNLRIVQMLVRLIHSSGIKKPRLAQQVEGEVKKYSSFNLFRSVCLCEGGARSEQVDACKDGVEIVIATPCRLANLSSNGIIDLAKVSYVVLDEADRMLDMGFEASTRRILLETRPDRLVALTRKAVVKYDVVSKWIKEDGVDPICGEAMTEDVVIELQRGGTGYAATNEFKAKSGLGPQLELQQIIKIYIYLSAFPILNDYNNKFTYQTQKPQFFRYRS